MLVSRLFGKLPCAGHTNVSLLIRVLKGTRAGSFKATHHLNLRNSFDVARIAEMKQRKAWKDRKRRREDASPQAKEGSNEEVLDFEVTALLDRFAKEKIALDDQDDGKNAESKRQEPFSELELEIEEVSSTGDGLAMSSERDMVYIVPFTLPGDKVLAKTLMPSIPGSYVRTDLLKVLRDSPQRKDSEINCKYFAECSGCQLQMLPYEDQLAHKKTIIEKAYKYFSSLPPAQVPSVGDTIGSPLRYGYRTKLTPHFDGPKGPKSQRRYTEVPPIGFAKKGRRQVMDIENCPIGTPTVQEGYKAERARIADTFDTFTNGATLLIRESTERTFTTNPQTSPPPSPSAPPGSLQTDLPNPTDTKTYVTSGTATTTEYVDDWVFHNRAGSFFQNNNSILPSFTAYVRSHILPPTQPDSQPNPAPPPISYLLDAYCGSGLFAITLSPHFKSTLGIDIDIRAIAAARSNAQANSLSNIGFIEADAEALFADVPFPAAETAVVLDPPRKGCSGGFLRQLLRFGARRVVYVSCNVHSQALDVGVLVRGEGGARYEVESVRGFDFFPQTAHVESVAFLTRVDEGKGKGEKEKEKEGSNLDGL